MLLDSKPLKIQKLEEQYHLNFKAIRFVFLSNKNTEGFKVQFSDKESFYVFLDKLEINRKEMFDADEQTEVLYFIYNNTKYNILLILDVDETYSVIFPCITDSSLIENKEY